AQIRVSPDQSSQFDPSDRRLRKNQQRPAFRSEKFTIHVAGEVDREAIYQARHEVYARELGQHTPNGAGRLSDALDSHNAYVAAHLNGSLAGFISITPPEAD